MAAPPYRQNDEIFSSHFFLGESEFIELSLGAAEPRGPHKLASRHQGVAATGLVAHWSGALTSSQAQKFSKIPEKIILNFQDHRRTFIFEVFFSGTLKQKTGKAKIIPSFFF